MFKVSKEFIFILSLNCKNCSLVKEKHVYSEFSVAIITYSLYGLTNLDMTE